jgi:glycerophosphoryl diester phosphodiesterase
MAWLVLAFVSGKSPAAVKAKLASSVVAIQVPAKAYGFDFTNTRFIEFIHQVGLGIHVWTIDSEPEMQRLYARGVDAVMTDRPSILKSVLLSRGQWKGD